MTINSLAESYINGNISFVRNKIRPSGALALAVAEVIFNQQGEDGLRRFITLMT
jgi:hypothetical protein